MRYNLLAIRQRIAHVRWAVVAYCLNLFLEHSQGIKINLNLDEIGGATAPLVKRSASLAQ
jgi:hypothetical protein